MARTRRRDVSTVDLEKHQPAPDAFQQRIEALVALHTPADVLNPSAVGRITAAVLIEGLADANNQELSVPAGTGETSGLRGAVERSVSAVMEQVLARDLSDPSAVAAQIVETCLGAEPKRHLDKGELVWILATAYSVALELKASHPGISERIARAPSDSLHHEEAEAGDAPAKQDETAADKAPVELDRGDVTRMAKWADVTTVGFLVHAAFMVLRLTGKMSLPGNFVWLSLVTFTAAAIPFLMWFRLVFVAAQKVSPELFEELGSVWAVAAWFVPLLNFVFPFVIAKRIRTAFVKNAQLPPEPPLFLYAWWGCWVFGGIAASFNLTLALLLQVGACVFGVGFVWNTNATYSLPLPHDEDGPLLSSSVENINDQDL